MESNNGSVCAAVSDPPATTDVARDLTLFQIEDSIALLAEAAEEEA